ncbi:Putative SKP1/BTB/POZ domain superfamily protein [Septoria linicola]|uniref:SKP1/BTB/POZ domain superfamily protein n=1 Tax=Septoria linicola TaxID=215465 RepID=A0A9Q9AWK4_9PEZI|nr:putative SKP1/BTB/POZ domain superfamily protein [Septoria linicola]USW53151.1 Putative SKP1/BTB/POZ domain superfamily protein [Septoria linicola]
MAASTAPQTTSGSQPLTGSAVPDHTTPGEVPVFQSITASLLESISLEELRLRDYGAGRTPLTTAKPNLCSGPSGPPVKLTVRSAENGSSEFRGTMLTFEVGADNPESFLIHEGVAKRASEFVRLALQRDWQEATNRIISLPDDEPDIFEIYQSWLYERKIYTPFWLGAEQSADEPVRLVKAWALGDKLLDIDFKDAVMDALINRMRSISPAFAGYRRLNAFIYSITPDKSAPRRLMTDIFAHEGNANWTDDPSCLPEDPYTADFLRDLAKEQYRLRQRLVGSSQVSGEDSGPLYRSLEATCRYHDHEFGKCPRRA